MKILVSDPLSEEGLKILQEEKSFQVDVKAGLKPQELKDIIKNYEALIVRSGTKVTKEIIDAAANLKVIGRAGAGLDNVDLEAATARGIIVMNTPGGNTISTAEHTMSMMLALSRSIPQASASMKAGEWKRSKFLGKELQGKTLGIVGLGRVGSEVAKRSLSFGMRIIAFDPFISLEIAKQLGVEVLELNEVLKRADYITIHTPLAPETKNLISDEQFAMMKKDARIINCARGGIINEAALARALESGKIAGCALDVFEQEPPPADLAFLKKENVIATPHLGASTEEAQVNVAIEIAHAVKDALLGKGVRNAANFPCVEPEVCKILDPYTNLAEKLGALATQLIDGRISQADIVYTGSIVQFDSRPMTMALVKGLLTPIVQETVNFVNALRVAKERGIKIQESKSEQEEEYVNLITLELVTDKEKLRIAGTLSANKQPRIVKINNFYVEAVPSGYMIFTNNWDKPGIVGALGMLLGKNKVNIAGMTFGREKEGGRAISVTNVDSAISNELLKQIEKTENILSVKLVKL